MWKRKVKLTIKSIPVSSEDKKSAYDDGLLLAVLENYRIDFVMQSQLGWSADELKIDVYNLDPSLVGSLMDSVNKVFTLEAGYEDEGMNIIMTGGITNVWGRKEIPNHITTMWCVPLSAFQPSQPFKIDPPRTFDNTKLKDALNMLAKDAGYTKDCTFIGMSDEVLNYVLKSKSIKGTLAEALDELGDLFKFNFQATESNIKIISQLTSRTVIDQIASKEVNVHTIALNKVKGNPSVDVAQTTIKVVLDTSIKAGNVVDITSLVSRTVNNSNNISKKGVVYNYPTDSIINMNSEVLFRDPNAYKYFIYNRYQILSLIHSGSNYSQVWDTTISGVVFNERGTAGSHDAAVGSGMTPMRNANSPEITHDKPGVMSIYLPDDDVLTQAERELAEMISGGPKGRGAESAAGEAGYSMTNSIAPPEELTEMTIGEVYDWQSQYGLGKAPATGKYQMMPTTMMELAQQAGLDREDVFDKDNQDRLFKASLNRGLGKADNLREGVSGIADIYAAVPKDESGLSAYEGRAGNTALMGYDDVAPLVGNVMQEREN